MYWCALWPDQVTRKHAKIQIRTQNRTNVIPLKFSKYVIKIGHFVFEIIYTLQYCVVVGGVQELLYTVYLY